jgi:hypothetical protein
MESGFDFFPDLMEDQVLQNDRAAEQKEDQERKGD